jgi:hypothetical protein
MTEEVAAPVEGQAAPVEGAVTSWTDGFNDDMKGYIEKKGFADAGALAESYQNLEKLRGVPAEQLLQLPADMSDLEAMSPVYSKMGRPDAPDGYTNVLGEGFNDEVFKSVAETAHQLGLGDGQFQGLQQIMQEQSTHLKEQMDAESAAAFDAWKSDKPEDFNNSARLLANLDMDESAVESLLNGDKTAMYDMLAKIAARSSEGDVVHGEQPKSEGFGMSPQAAKAKVQELMADETFMKNYTSDNRLVRQPAIERMSKLQEIAANA